MDLTTILAANKSKFRPITSAIKPASIPERDRPYSADEGMHPTARISEKEFYFEEGCYIQELYNHETDRKISIARARVPSGMTTKFHRLQGIAEYYVILSGTGRVEIGENAPQEVSPGDVVAIPSGYRQRITNTGADDLVFLCCCTPKFNEQQYEALE